MIKKKWKRPQLVILTQSKAGENVLSLCKHIGAVGGGSGNYYAGCIESDTIFGKNCYSCNKASSS